MLVRELHNPRDPDAVAVQSLHFRDCPDFLDTPIMTAGHAVMLVREPQNPHDPDAVAVQSLHGHGLGYIPRNETFKLPQPVTFGRVESIGAEANTGNLGLTVRLSKVLTPSPL